MNKCSLAQRVTERQRYCQSPERTRAVQEERPVSHDLNLRELGN